MLNTDSNTTEIQAFPIHSKTFIGVATDQNAAKKIIHLDEDDTLVFHYTTGDITVTAVAPMDFSVSGDCTGVTSTTEIMVS